MAVCKMVHSPVTSTTAGTTMQPCDQFFVTQSALQLHQNHDSLILLYEYLAINKHLNNISVLLFNVNTVITRISLLSNELGSYSTRLHGCLHIRFPLFSHP
jgi:hypothetical protein